MDVRCEGDILVKKKRFTEKKGDIFLTDTYNNLEINSQILQLYVQESTQIKYTE